MSRYPLPAFYVTSFCSRPSISWLPLLDQREASQCQDDESFMDKNQGLGGERTMNNNICRALLRDRLCGPRQQCP